MTKIILGGLILAGGIYCAPAEYEVTSERVGNGLLISDGHNTMYMPDKTVSISIPIAFFDSGFIQVGFKLDFEGENSYTQWGFLFRTVHDTAYVGWFTVLADGTIKDTTWTPERELPQVGDSIPYCPYCDYRGGTWLASGNWSYGDERTSPTLTQWECPQCKKTYWSREVTHWDQTLPRWQQFKLAHKDEGN